MRTRLILVAVVVLVAAAVGGADPTWGQKGPIKIGFLSPVTGGAAQVGKDMVNGISMYLAEKGLTPPYEDVELRARAHKTPQFLALNSLGQVPTLELDDGSTISESVAICRYFEALHPEPALFGRTPAEQAAVEMWIRRIELQLMQPVGLFCLDGRPQLKAVTVPTPDLSAYASLAAGVAS